MVNPVDYEEQDRVYVRNGKLYKVLAYCQEPTITMVNISDYDDRVTFGLGGLLNNEFEEVKGLRINSGLFTMKEDENG